MMTDGGHRGCRVRVVGTRQQGSGVGGCAQNSAGPLWVGCALAPYAGRSLLGPPAASHVPHTRTSVAAPTHPTTPARPGSRRRQVGRLCAPVHQRALQHTGVIGWVCMLAGGWVGGWVGVLAGGWGRVAATAPFVVGGRMRHCYVQRTWRGFAGQAHSQHSPPTHPSPPHAPSPQARRCPLPPAASWCWRRGWRRRARCRWAP